MDNNELNNKEQNDFENQVMMDSDQTQTPIQQNSVNLNQGMNTIIQNNINNAQNNINKENTDDEIDTIFSDSESDSNIPSSNNENKPKEKNKKGFVILIIILLVILGIAGYIVYDKYFNTTNIKPTVPDINKKEIEPKKVLLIDDSKEVVYSLIDELHEGVVRRIPYININSKYAQDINDEIEKLTKNGYLEGQIKDSYLTYKVDYQYYVNDEIVSIKFSWETEIESKTYSKIYNINQYTGEKVLDTDIMKAKNIDPKSFGNMLAESYKVARPFDTVAVDQNTKDCYQKDLDTLESGKIKGMYLNNNELYVLFDLNYVAGAGLGEALLNVTQNKVILNPVTLE